MKHRVHMENMGLQPWLEDFKWRVCDFQYHWYLGPKAHRAIRENASFGASRVEGPVQVAGQGKRQKLEVTRSPNIAGGAGTSTGGDRGDGLVDVVPGGRGAAHPQPQLRPEYQGRRIPLRTFIPNIVPQRRQSNPFCLSSSNVTGWVDARGKSNLLRETKPRTKHQISGTDDRIPEMPKYK